MYMHIEGNQFVPEKRFKHRVHRVIWTVEMEGLGMSKAEFAWGKYLWNIIRVIIGL